jgi:hypothetical protein
LLAYSVVVVLQNKIYVYNFGKFSEGLDESLLGVRLADEVGLIL